MKLRTLGLVFALSAAAAGIMAAKSSPVPNIQPAILQAAPAAVQTPEWIQMTWARQEVANARNWRALVDFNNCKYQAIHPIRGVGNVRPTPAIEEMCHEWTDVTKLDSVMRLENKKPSIPMSVEQARYHLRKLPVSRPETVISGSLFKMMPVSFNPSGTFN